MNLSQKETMLLKDMKTQEQLCIEKYALYAQRANDHALQQLFSTLESNERRHLNTLEEIGQGVVPVPGAAQQQSSKPNVGSAPNAGSVPNVGSNSVSAQQKQQDAFLCQDALSMEKHVSSVYDTGIFEFTNEGQRNALNHIQKEEQEHGKKLYDYLSQNNLIG